jgi:hypothetical protein
LSRTSLIGGIWRTFEASCGYRIVKKTPPMLAVCERCKSEFRPVLSNHAARWEIAAQFEAHKCVPLEGKESCVRETNPTGPQVTKSAA